LTLINININNINNIIRIKYLIHYLIHYIKFNI